MPEETVLLKNGARVPRPMVVSITTSLGKLLEMGMEGAIAFYELTMLCRNPKRSMDQEARKLLIQLNLVQKDGKVHDIVKDVVLSAAKGERLDMTLVSPIKSD